MCALLASRTAQATPYEVFVDIDEEGDLQDLLAAGTITEETYNELLDLLSRGVDLVRADRNELYTLPNLTYEDVDAIIAYRQLNRGRIKDPSELVTAGALSEEKLLAISSFIITRQPGENPLAASGWVRVMSRVSQRDFDPYAPQDPFLPPLGLRARVVMARHLSAGLALTTTRQQIGDPVFDPSRGALIADDRSYQVHVPKGYLKWETDTIDAVVGTYRAGFGQRLVFDNSSAYSPNGLYTDDQLFYTADLSSACKLSDGELLTDACPDGTEYVTPDFNWRQGLFGGAIGLKKLELPTGWLQAYAWGSMARRSIYQYELVNRDTCVDPQDDSDPGCSAPNVYVKPEGNILDPAARHSFATLPNVFQEQLVGGNVTYFADRRNTVGVTAYGARQENLIAGIDLDLQEWSRYPTGKKFGAVGANFSFGRGWLDVFGEAAVSFDAMPEQDPTLTKAKGGGGPAVIIRTTATRKREELEVLARYYSTDFLNPYGRPISGSDQFDGQRARDELGGRVRYINTGKELVIRALADIWINPSVSGTPPKIDTYVRANVKTTPKLWLGLWERFQDRNLTTSGNDQCFETGTEEDVETGEPTPCGGMQLTTIARASYEADKTLSVTVQLQHQLLDDNSRAELMNKFRQDVSAWLVSTYRPNKDMRFRFRLRFADDAIHDNTYLERSLAGRLEGTFRMRMRDSLRVRVDVRSFMDKRSSTLLRVPNPEASLWLFYEARL